MNSWIRCARTWSTTIRRTILSNADVLTQLHMPLLQQAGGRQQGAGGSSPLGGQGGRLRNRGVAAAERRRGRGRNARGGGDRSSSDGDSDDDDDDDVAFGQVRFPFPMYFVCTYTEEQREQERRSLGYSFRALICSLIVLCLSFKVECRSRETNRLDYIIQ